MEAIVQIARREYLQIVRTKAFLVGTLLGPVLMLALFAVPMLLLRSGAKDIRCAVFDESGQLYRELERVAGEPGPGGSRFVLTAVEAVDDPAGHYAGEIARGRFDAFLHLPADVLAAGQATYYAKSIGVDSERVDRLLTRVATGRRLVARGIEPDQVDALTQRVKVESFQVGKGGKKEKKDFLSVYLMTMFLVMLLYGTTIMYGVSVLNSVVQEKSNRIVEVVLSQARPIDLLLGKLLGTAAVGFTQYAVWGVAGTLLIGGAGAALAATGAAGMAVPASAFVWLLVFFLLGFLSYAALYAAVGSMCNSPQEAQQMSQPLTFLVIAAMMLTFLVVSHPEARLGVVLSFVPFFSPLLMFARIMALTPPLGHILLAVAINLAAIPATLWLAARVYRIGILMYGKRPTLTEMIRWVRAS